MRSATAVYPERSAKSTVTWRRSSGGLSPGPVGGDGPAESLEPQDMQKRACSGVDAPQDGQRRSSLLPQDMQKRA